VKAALLASLVAGTTILPAQAQTLDDWHLARIAPGPKRFFHDGDRTGCPEAAACRRRAYVMPGDMVLVEAVRGRFAGVVFVAADKGMPTKGWIETAALIRVPDSAPAAKDWQGHWQGWDAEIEIGRATPGTLRVEGAAIWGSHDPERVANGGVHTGDFSGTLAPQGALMRYPGGEGDLCRIEMRLIGTYLVAEDNGECGGVNVRFTGIYRRR
jgi:hypothetical protein